MGRTSLRRTRFRFAAFIPAVVALSMAAALLPTTAAPAYADEFASELEGVHCRSVDGDGETRVSFASNPSTNGSYTSDLDRPGDTISGLRIEPVYATRMYVDPRNGFDATYIAYRVENPAEGGPGPLENVWIELSNFVGPDDQHASSAVRLANPNDARQHIGSLQPGDTVTKFFLVRASSLSDADQHHEVRLYGGNPLGDDATVYAGCRTAIEGVKRSIAANPNRVTDIRVKVGDAAVSDENNLRLGETLTIEVDGSPGRVGDGADPDGKITALSPTSYAQWPTRALRLEHVVYTLKGLQQSDQTRCNGANGNRGALAGTGNDRTFTLDASLVIRNCDRGQGPGRSVEYHATYTFRVVGGASTDPVIRPIASISSGTQVKYTGSFPSTEVAVPLSSAETEVTVSKAVVLGAEEPPIPVDSETGRVEVTYELTFRNEGESAVRLDAIMDELRADEVDPTLAEFVVGSGEYEYPAATTRLMAPVVLTTDEGAKLLRFDGPFKLEAAGEAKLRYTMRLPVPDPGDSVEYLNVGYGLLGTTVVGNAAGKLSGVIATVDGTGVTELVTDDEVDRPLEPQSISFTPPLTLGADTTVTLDGYADSGLPLTYSVVAGDGVNCSVTQQFDGSWTLTTDEPGSCTVRASQAGDDTYAAADDVDVEITVLEGQTITIDELDNGDGLLFDELEPLTVTVSASSGLEPTLASVDVDVCTVSINTAFDAEANEVVYLVEEGAETGTCILVVNQSGNDVYGPAPEREVTVGVGDTQTIVWTQEPIDATTADTVTVSAWSSVETTGDNSLPVSFSVETPSVCTVASETVNLTTPLTTATLALHAAGTCEVVATQDGYTHVLALSDYAPVDDSRTFTVSSSGASPQTIRFVDAEGEDLPTLESEALDDKRYGDAFFSVAMISEDDANEATDLQVSLAGTDGVCGVAGQSFNATTSVTSYNVQLLGAGECTLTASQPGDDTYGAAEEATFTFTVGKAQLTLPGLTVQDREYDGTTDAALTGSLDLEGRASGDGTLEVRFADEPTASFGDSNAGEDKPVTLASVGLTGTKADDYELVDPALTATITARAITITAADLDGHIRATALPSLEGWTVTVTSGDIVAGDNDGLMEAVEVVVVGDPETLVSDVGTSEDVFDPRFVDGTNTSIPPFANYSVTWQAGSLTVIELTVAQLDLPEPTITYGDALPTFDPGADGWVTYDDGEGSTGTVAGTYTITVTIQATTYTWDDETIPYPLDAGDYTVTLSFTPTETGTYAPVDEETFTLTVEPATLGIDGLSIATREYDATSSATVLGTDEAALTGRVAGDTANEVALAEDWAAALEATFSSAAVGGPQDVVVDLSAVELVGSARDNYILPATIDLTGTITAKVLTVGGDVATKTYDATTAATVTSLTISGALGEEVVALADGWADQVSATFDDATAETDKSVEVSLGGVGLEGADAANYALPTTVELTGTIEQREVTLSNLAAPGKTYDGTTAATVEFGEPALGNIVEDDTVTLDTTGHSATFDEPNAGSGRTVTVTGLALTGGDAGNYTLPDSITVADVTIEKFSVNVTADSATYVLGDGFTTDPRTFAVASLETDGEDTVELPTSWSTAQDGIHVVVDNDVVDLADDPEADEYPDALVPAFDGSAPAAADNYDIAFVKGTLTVIELIVPTIDVDDITVTYPQTLDSELSITFSYTDESLVTRALVLGDNDYENNVWSIDGVGTVTLTGTPTTLTSDVVLDAHEAGYTVTVTFEPEDELKFAERATTFTLTVQRKQLTVTGVTADGKVYDGTDAVTLDTEHAALDGVVDGDAVTLDVDAASAAFPSSDVGTYDLTVSGLALTGEDAFNYSLATTTVTSVAITARELTVTAEDKTIQVRAGVPDWSVTIDNWPVGWDSSTRTTFAADLLDDLEFVADIDDDATEEYTTPIEVSLKGGATYANVTFAFTDGTLTVTPLPVPELTVPDDQNITYGDGLPALSSLPDLRADVDEDDGEGSTTTTDISEDGTFVVTIVIGDDTHDYDDAPRLDAGSYTVTVTFTPDETNKYASNSKTFTVSVAKKVAQVVIDDAVKFVADDYPAYDYTLDDIVSGDDDSVRDALTVGPTGDTGVPGAYTIEASGSHHNYTFDVTTGTLYVARMDINVNESNGVLTSRNVNCTCEGLAPDAPISLTILSDSVVLADTHTLSTGAHDVASTIPTSVPDGDHTLEVVSTFPNGVDATSQRAVTLHTPQQSSSNNASRSSNPPAETAEPVEQEPLTAPAPTPPPPPPPAPPSASQPAGPVTPAPTPPAPPSSPAPPQASGPTAPAPAAQSRETIDFGDGPVDSSSASFQEMVDRSQRNLRQLRNEALGGFAPGTGTRIEVLGSRTTGRFVLSDITQIDVLAIAHAIRTSAQAQAVDFAAITSAEPTTDSTFVPFRWTDEEREAAYEVFGGTRLPNPQLLSEMNIPDNAVWLGVTVAGSSYVPGSVVYLAFTSDPIVVAQGVVADDGTVELTGSVPLQLLGVGEHRVRLIGSRELGGVTVDADGEVVLAQATLDEIAKFDLATQATVRVIGVNETGGSHVALRIVPLDPIAPWWTLWIIAAATAIIVTAQLRRRIRTFRARVIASSVLVASGVPAVILGWQSTVTAVVWWGAGLSLLAAWIPWLIWRRRRDEEPAGGDGGETDVLVGAGSPTH